MLWLVMLLFFTGIGFLEQFQLRKVVSVFLLFAIVIISVCFANLFGVVDGVDACPDYLLIVFVYLGLLSFEGLDDISYSSTAKMAATFVWLLNDYIESHAEIKICEEVKSNYF